jgi:putative proteasome-type protease
VRYETTTLEQAIKYANSSIDSTMRSNLTVGPPVDLAVYGRDEFAVSRQVRLSADDPMLIAIRTQWEQELRAAVQRLPTVTFGLR